MSEDSKVDFTKCPVCRLREELAEILGKPELKLGNGEDRFCEMLGNELKENGLARDEWNFRYDIRQGLVLDKTKLVDISVGTEIPTFIIETDVCADCGVMYSTGLTKGYEKKPPPPPKLILPNRAERRREGRQEDNPFSSS